MAYSVVESCGRCSLEVGHCVGCKLVKSYQIVNYRGNIPPKVVALVFLSEREFDLRKLLLKHIKSKERRFEYFL